MSQELPVLEAEVRINGNKWEKYPTVTGPDALCILGMDYLKKGCFKDPKRYRWASAIAAVETEGTLHSCLPYPVFQMTITGEGGQGSRL